MEVELKYRVENQEVFDKLIANYNLSLDIVEKSHKEISLEAIYFDTEGMDLAKKEISFRYRKENEENVATVKWKGENIGGLHRRNEENFFLKEDEDFLTSTIDKIAGLSVGREIRDVSKIKSLLPMIKTKVLRKVFRVKIHESLVEFAMDKGIVIAGGKREPILELEIELVTGKEEDLIEIGTLVARKLGLEPKEKSKFKTGLELLGNII